MVWPLSFSFTCLVQTLQSIQMRLVADSITAVGICTDNGPFRLVRLSEVREKVYKEEVLGQGTSVPLVH